MSHPPRSDTAARPLTIRATAVERRLWSRAARLSSAPSLNEALRSALNQWAAAMQPGSTEKLEAVLAVRPRQGPAREQATPKQPENPRPRHKRCPRCNQRLFVVNGEIEPHVWPPVNGKASVQCLDTNV
jgi:hypothetical protein